MARFDVDNLQSSFSKDPFKASNRRHTFSAGYNSYLASIIIPQIVVQVKVAISSLGLRVARSINDVFVESRLEQI